MINHNTLIRYTLLMLIFIAGCKKDDPVTPSPEEPALTMEQLYQNAILDAMVADSSEVVDTLWQISKENTALQWKTINGKDYVLLASFMRYPESYPEGDSITNVWGESWVFIPQQMKARIGNKLDGTSDTTMRICQLLGLPPANERSNTHIAELWVNPERLYRPAGNPNIDTRTAGAVLSNDVSATYNTWFNNYILFAYYRTLSGSADFHYPWTRLGYTYDWAPDNPEVGLSEYVLQVSSGAWVEHVSPVESYF